MGKSSMSLENPLWVHNTFKSSHTFKYLLSTSAGFSSTFPLNRWQFVPYQILYIDRVKLSSSFFSESTKVSMAIAFPCISWFAGCFNHSFCNGKGSAVFIRGILHLNRLPANSLKNKQKKSCPVAEWWHSWWTKDILDGTHTPQLPEGCMRYQTFPKIISSAALIYLTVYWASTLCLTLCKLLLMPNKTQTFLERAYSLER